MRTILFLILIGRIVKKDKIFIVSKDRIWTSRLCNQLESQCIEHSLYTDESYIEATRQHQPDWIFFFHWSKKVEKDFHSNNRCVVIHTSNLPQFRGGSPLQNQIFNKVTSTQVNAIEMRDTIDSGGIYASCPISLHGSLQDIWLQIADTTSALIQECVLDRPTPQEQAGSASTYKRLKGSRIGEVLENSNSIEEVYDHIRALDGDGYGGATMDIGSHVMRFSRAKMTSTDSILCDLVIKKKCIGS